jgi:hypothetical protein
VAVLEGTFATGAAGRAGGSDGRNRIARRAGTVERNPLGKSGRQLVNCGRGTFLGMHGLSPGVMEKTQARTAAAKIFSRKITFSLARSRFLGDAEIVRLQHHRFWRPASAGFLFGSVLILRRSVG